MKKDNKEYKDICILSLSAFLIFSFFNLVPFFRDNLNLRSQRLKVIIKK
jgi:hypothetical protein